MRFTGIFLRFGTRTGWTGRGRAWEHRTVLLRDIRDDEGNRVADHLWFNLNKGFAELGLLEGGERIAFNARVRSKGYFARRNGVYKPVRKDYKLSNPTKIKKI